MNIFAMMLKKIYKITIIPYVVFLLYMLFLGYGRIQFDENVIRIQPLFSTWLFIENTFRLKTIIIVVLGNILMFVPFGFLGWALPKLNDFKILLINFVSAITIVEALQYFTRMGVFDVDDILLNTFGVVIGFYIKKIIEKRLTKLVF